MPNDRIGATNLFLWQKLKSALMWCIYAFHYYLIIKLHRLVPSRTICRSSITPRDLECMLCDETADPIALPLSLLEEITYGFSNDQEIGRGGFAVVYKGKLEHRTVAVKRMSNMYMYEKEFHREVECLMIAKHKNVVRFLGYCADTQGSMEKYEGKFVMADVQQKLLCFEYLPKGSLHEYITDTSREPRWRDCYQIITGICQGLHYLHKNNIIHLDLKPANILLDDNLVAKIADFGLSRCFIGETGSQVISKIAGTHGYLAPESFNHRTQVTYRHSYRLDIYSLGVVIMEILTGEKDYHILDNVVERWSNKVEKSKSDIELKQVRVCAEIGIQCIDSNPAKRPNTQHIINRLDETKTMDGYSGTGAITSQQDKHPPYELHQDKPNAQGQASSEDKATIVTVADTNPYINLQWRYLHLNPDIRRCFEYCSIFPRGSKVIKGKLVSLWIAQGFVKTSFAGEDMEDVAESYIQELVSCSFLEPVKTCLGVGDLTDCFSFHTVVHDLLDKVVGNDCFRIENERSQRGEGWKGDVPRDVCHLFVQKYNSDLIIEKILALENLCTLIFDVVGKEAPVEKNVIESICKKLPKLRVLAFAFRHEHCSFVQPNNIFSVPESICQLKHLCYLAFRTSILCKVILPNTLNKLQHIRLLDFGRGQILEFSFPDLITLRHIICGPDMECPKDIGMLTSLQTIPKFTVRNGQGYEVKQLRDLNKLCGSLVIRCLDNIKSKEEALEANLAAKERLTDLNLQWKVRHNAKIQVEVLEGLCPPMGLKKLTIWRYIGWSYPDWMVGKQKGGPKDLQHLDFSECGQPRGPAPQIVEAFPHLHVLLLSSCHWDSLPGNMEHLTSLKYLDIMYCENIRSLPTLPHSLEKICLYHCNVEFMKTCETDGHPNWQKIKHIPEKKITYWSLMAGPTID